MAEAIENLSAEEAVKVLQERIGSDGTLAVVSLLGSSQDALLARVDARLDHLEARIDRRFDEHEQRMDERFRTIDRRFDAVDRRFDAVDRRFETIEARFDNLGHQVNTRIDGTLRYAITFSLSLLGLVAAIATGFLAWRW